MKRKIRSYVMGLSKETFDLKDPLVVQEIKKLGQGTGNINYLVKISGKKFTFRFNVDKNASRNAKREFRSLKIVEPLGIAPKPFLLDTSYEYFDMPLLVIGFIEGRTINEADIYLTNRMIPGLARLLATVHAVRLTPSLKKLKVEVKDYRSVYSWINSYLNYIKKNVEDGAFISFLEKAFKSVKKDFSPYDTKKLVLTQGDFCEQNIIYHKRKYSLIDFEYLGLTDPYFEIAKIMVDFGKPFTEEQRTLFFKEYSKIKKLPQIKKHTEAWFKIIYLLVFLWSIQHTLKVKNKEFGEKFYEGNNIKKDLAYVRTMLKRNIRAGVIDNTYSYERIKELIIT